MKGLTLIIVIALVIIGAFMLVPKKQNKGGAVVNETNSTAAVTKAVIETDKGNIELDLYPDVAPKTVTNFVDKARSGYFNGLKFHRVEDWVIQGGDPKSRTDAEKDLWGTGGGNIDTELSNKPFGIGALGVARGNDIKISNDSQFFITKKDSQFLNNEYTLFGQVTAGMDVVEKISVGDLIKSVVIK